MPGSTARPRAVSVQAKVPGPKNARFIAKIARPAAVDHVPKVGGWQVFETAMNTASQSKPAAKKTAKLELAPQP
jgi:hypothetical protein